MTENVATMSEANRQGLRYLAMLKQSRKSSGDFAKTIESPANQLRIMGDQMKQLGRSIGNFLIGPLTTVLPYINAVIMAIRTMLSFANTLRGFKPLGFGGATEHAEELADSVGGVGAAADGAASKLKALVAPFDELNVLQDQASSAAGGGGLDAEIMDPELLKAIAELETKFESINMKANILRDRMLEFFGLEYDDGNLVMVLDGIADRFTKAIKAENFYGVGRIIAETLNIGTQRAIEGLSWSNVGDALSQKVLKITSTINGFFNNYDWNAFGQAIGAGIDTAIHMAAVFVTDLDFGAIGAALGQGISGTIQKIDWAVLAKGLSEVVIGIADFVVAALSNIDWEAFGKALSSFMTNINWSGLLASVGRAILVALAAAIMASAHVVTSVLTVIADAITEGFKDGLLSGFRNIASWLKENIVNPVLDAIKGFFGIRSPSTVFAEIGVNLMLGFMEGMKSKLTQIFEWFDTKLINPIISKFQSMVASIQRAASMAWDAMSSGSLSKREQDTRDGKITTYTVTSPKMATGGVVTGPTTALIGSYRGSYTIG